VASQRRTVRLLTPTQLFDVTLQQWESYCVGAIDLQDLAGIALRTDRSQGSARRAAGISPTPYMGAGMSS